MYPVLRLGKEFYINRDASPLAIGETHVSRHICWPWDLDVFFEMNNGRVFTIFDLGRFVLFKRMGFTQIMKDQRLAGAVAGSTIRYRRRLRAFDRFEMRSRLVGWDNRFTYCEQSMWRNGECASHALIRMAVTNRNGIVDPNQVLETAGLSPELTLPNWVRNWIDAEATRPWPPQLT